jgi:N-hydroxyarylamine O-acetyltransferase
MVAGTIAGVRKTALSWQPSALSLALDITLWNCMTDVQSYLARIRYRGSTSPTLEPLRAIHYAHLLAVPFENLDISLARKIVLDEDAFIWKIVGRRRGGFCYELNGAFAALLRAMGFRVTLLSARVAGSDGGESPEFDHLTLRVDLDEPWLADVGFGDSFLEPLRMQPGVEQIDRAGTFRIVERGERLLLEKKEPDITWKGQYSFTLQLRRLEEFADMCEYHQTSPESHFTQNKICSRATPEGRITLAGMKLIVTRNGEREERVLGSPDEWRDILRERFDVVL